jgi:hypothetical protein
MPDPEKPFTIESDTSKFTSRAILHQQDINRDWHLCRYISHSFNQMERNYEIYDQELYEHSKHGIITFKDLGTW